MHSDNQMAVQKISGVSFIEEARRAQIIEAAIETLNEVGYAQATLAKIADKAGISTSLILYHFKDKQSLMAEVIRIVTSSWTVYVDEKLKAANDTRERLHIYIEANLAYMGTRPKNMSAMIELVFNARDLGTGLSYREMKEDPSLTSLENILIEGQKNGDVKDFDTKMMALTIRGAIDQFLGYLAIQPDFDLEAYTNHVIVTFDQVALKGRND